MNKKQIRLYANNLISIIINSLGILFFYIVLTLFMLLQSFQQCSAILGFVVAVLFGSIIIFIPIIGLFKKIPSYKDFSNIKKKLFIFFICCMLLQQFGFFIICYFSVLQNNELKNISVDNLEIITAVVIILLVITTMDTLVYFFFYKKPIDNNIANICEVNPHTKEWDEILDLINGNWNLLYGWIALFALLSPALQGLSKLFGLKNIIYNILEVFPINLDRVKEFLNLFHINFDLFNIVLFITGLVIFILLFITDRSFRESRSNYEESSYTTNDNLLSNEAEKNSNYTTIIHPIWTYSRRTTRVTVIGKPTSTSSSTFTDNIVIIELKNPKTNQPIQYTLTCPSKWYDMFKIGDIIQCTRYENIYRKDGWICEPPRPTD
ncbi:MAG: hypothetical protein Q4C40_00225 [Eubacteriales bacterium]|nr:hypothetical protein [Eubacteriales bacterium]